MQVPVCISWNTACISVKQIVKRRIMEFWGEANVFNPNQFEKSLYGYAAVILF